MKEYPLSMAPGYLSHWSVSDAVRELVQNALDRTEELLYRWYEEEDGRHTLTLTTPDVTLHQSLLLLGNGTKSDDEGSRGGFGEGMKASMLILAREGFNLVINNGSNIWMPVYKMNEMYDTEMLYVIETEGNPTGEDLVFTIPGLTSEEKETIISNTLAMQEGFKHVKGTFILDQPEHKGRVYVGGLFVATSDMVKGYNFSPEDVKLNRDRQMLPEWDLKKLVSELWCDSIPPAEVVAAVLDNTNDLSHISYTYSIPQSVNKAALDKHIEMHGNVPIADNYYRQQEMIEEGYTDTVFTGNRAFAEMVRECDDYKEVAKEVRISPEQFIRDTLEHIACMIPEDYEDEFDEESQRLIKEAKKWK